MYSANTDENNLNSVHKLLVFTLFSYVCSYIANYTDSESQDLYRKTSLDSVHIYIVYVYMHTAICTYGSQLTQDNLYVFQETIYMLILCMCMKSIAKCNDR